MFLFSIMRPNAKAQIIGIWIIPVNKTDELLFSVCVENWYASKGEVNEILKQGLSSGEQTVMMGKQDCWLEEAQPRWGCHLAAPEE